LVVPIRAPRRQHSHIASFAAIVPDTYSALVMEAATVGWILLTQLMAAPLQIKTYPVVERRESTSGLVRICISRRNRIQIHADAMHLITDKSLN